MQGSLIADAAAKAAIDAWKREHWESIPYIIAGHATSMLQTAMMTRVFHFVMDSPIARKGDLFAESPTRMQKAEHEQAVKTLKVVARPAISLTHELTVDKVRDVCRAILTGADRLCYNLLSQEAALMSPADVDVMLNLNLFKGLAVRNYAFIGRNVPVAYAHQFAVNVARDVDDLQNSVLQSDEMIVATTSSESVLGMYHVTPVEVKPVGYPDEKKQPIDLHYGDKQFDTGHEYHNRLEFNLVAEMCMTVHRPQAFIRIQGIPK